MAVSLCRTPIHGLILHPKTGELVQQSDGRLGASEMR